MAIPFAGGGKTLFTRTLLIGLGLLISLASGAGSLLASPADDTHRALTTAVNAGLAGLTADEAAEVNRLCRSLESAFAMQAGFLELTKPSEFVARIDELHPLHAGVEALVTQALAQRGAFAALPDLPERRAKIQAYLQITSSLIDLSARLRYTLFDATTDAAFELQPQSPEMHELIAVLTKHRSSIGASAIIDELFIPPATNQPAAIAAANTTKRKLLQLIASTKHADLVSPVAEFLQNAETSPELVVQAAATIHALGVPQPTRPNAEPGLPSPAITARGLAQRLSSIRPRSLESTTRNERDQWVAYFNAIANRGVTEEKYQLGESEVRPGDWLLMRNPSPYNRFTDLAPGLFTHVGVITTETGADGIRRMVLVDLPERGKVIHPVCIDTYVKRTLHYVVLRHPDPQVAAKMAATARAIIGNPSQFDLNFRTDRIEQLRGQSLAGKTIHTYCAGLLLLCSQETGAPRTDFFPIEEFAAGGNTVTNLATLGLSFGAGFISPTGALFSPKMEIVGKRPAMYSPKRDVADQIYDHFALQLIEQTLTPSPDVYQSLRLKLAEAGRANPLLGKALANALNVNENLDLVSAAKAAAVVETLDEVANTAGDKYEQALAALRATDEDLAQQKLSAAQKANMAAYRQTHADLFKRWTSNQISPRGLRIALVDYYTLWGRQELDRRFFEVPRM